MKIRTPGGHKTPWGVWYPIRGHESTGYTFRFIGPISGPCAKCDLQTGTQNKFAVRVQWQDEEVYWCLTCFASWATVNGALVYASVQA